jgi:starvation-inducible DNA-binding protein
MKSRTQEQKTTNRLQSDDAQPRMHQEARETQAFGSVIRELPLGLPAESREEIVQQLNRILADTMTLRDLYKKSHWQVSGPTFYQLHLLFDKHFTEQVEAFHRTGGTRRCNRGAHSAARWHQHCDGA